MRICGNCQFWERKKLQRTGYCRRRAPTQVDPTGHAVFPLTSDNDWCGEFDPKPIPQPGEGTITREPLEF